jgi:RNA polymerase sigma factor (sigma-70 family)
VRRYDPRIRAYVRRAGPGALDADEVAGDVWALAVEHEGVLRDVGEPWDILVRDLRRVCADQMRVRRREVTWNDAKRPPESTGDESDSSRLDEICSQLERALAGLSKRQRDIIKWRHWHGWSYERIALKLECRPATVRWHHARTVKQLREHATPELLDGRSRPCLTSAALSPRNAARVRSSAAELGSIASVGLKVPNKTAAQCS